MVTCYLPDGSIQKKPMKEVKAGDIFRTDLHPEGPTYKATGDATLQRLSPNGWWGYTCPAEIIEVRSA